MGPFYFKFFRCTNDFILQKVYFSRLRQVYVGLIMLAAYFCQSCNHKWDNCELIELAWLAACIAQRVVGAALVVFLRRWRKISNLHNPPANGSKGRYQKKCPKPCWPIRSKENWTKEVHAADIITPMLTARHTCCVIKSFEQLKNLKTCFVPYLGLELTIHAIKSLIHLVRQQSL